jgi:Zn-finger nucleic acid-binding protein
MAKAAVGRVELHNKDIMCPRDNTLLKAAVVGEAELDTCQKCFGTFFDSGEMFKAFGLKADPSYWDHEATGGVVKESTLHCPRCVHSLMVAQDVAKDGKHVEIDRCGHCGGIWLDKGEMDTIIAVGESMKPVLDAEKAQAEADLARMGTPDFGSPGLIASFLGLFKKKG